MTWLKINNSNILFVELLFVECATILSPDKKAVGQIGVKNGRINGS